MLLDNFILLKIIKKHIYHERNNRESCKKNLSKKT